MNEYPHKEPRMDQFLARHTGEQLEELSGIAGRQPYASAGPLITPETLELLETGSQAGKLGRLVAGSRSTDLAPLVEAGLMTGKGTLTPQGRLVTGPWRESFASVRVSAQHQGRASNFQVWISAEGCLVLAGPSAAAMTSGSARADVHQVDFLAADHLYPALAAWIGIAPAWNVASAMTALDGELVGARVLDKTVAPPAGADEPLLNMWQQPWVTWRLVVEPAPETAVPATYVNAGSAGHYQLGRDEAGTQLTPIPSSVLYRVIAQQIDGLLR
ncbi:hypothetical protein [Arthrobacter sp. CAN_A1]|uniref:hypothetical protein n=1 Tax=Arthrobacter sp. CAN_A1 TaxID=2787717 RepID=UPI0018C90D10